MPNTKLVPQPVPMFYKGEVVRSRSWGLGRVMGEGEAPTIQLVHGGKHKIPSSDLTTAAEEDYEAQMANLQAIEDHLDLRIHGHVMRRQVALPEKFELVEAMRRDVARPDLGEEEPPSDGALYFVASELNDRAVESC